MHNRGRAALQRRVRRLKRRGFSPWGTGIGGLMSKKLWIVLVAVFVVVALAVIVPCLRGGEVSSRYQVLEPIKHGSLTIFPVVTSTSHDTHVFLTLDEGLRSGDVVVSESGSISPLV